MFACSIDTGFVLTVLNLHPAYESFFFWRHINTTTNDWILRKQVGNQSSFFWSFYKPKSDNFSGDFVHWSYTRTLPWTGYRVHGAPRIPGVIGHAHSVFESLRQSFFHKSFFKR